jgi:hypothetical protein
MLVDLLQNEGEQTGNNHRRGLAHLDLGVELLRNLLPLHLKRCRDKATLGRPFVRGKDDGLEHLERLEALLLARGIALAHDESPDIVLRAQVSKGGALVVERVSQIGLMRDNDPNGLLRVCICVHADVRYEVARLVGRL